MKVSPSKSLHQARSTLLLLCVLLFLPLGLGGSLWEGAPWGQGGVGSLWIGLLALLVGQACSDSLAGLVARLVLVPWLWGQETLCMSTWGRT